MTQPTTTNGDTRVTLALLGQKLDAIKADQDRHIATDERRCNDQELRIRMLEEGAVKRVEQIAALERDVEGHSEQIDKLRNRDTIGNLVAGIMAAVAGIIAFFKP